MPVTFGGSDPFLQQVVGGAMDASWGAVPGSRQVLPGPVSGLAGYLQNDMARAGLPELQAMIPSPTIPTGTGGGFTTQAADSVLPPYLQDIMGRQTLNGLNVRA
jgi:hypothetical protein